MRKIGNFHVVTGYGRSWYEAITRFLCSKTFSPSLAKY